MRNFPMRKNPRTEFSPPLYVLLMHLHGHGCLALDDAPGQVQDWAPCHHPSLCQGHEVETQRHVHCHVTARAHAAVASSALAISSGVQGNARGTSVFDGVVGPFAKAGDS